ncbi:MAG: hypothetical protein HY900_26760 [Deltaproteobacteria bacterium]|nr:hypothetical protein [Deltaproteobacteria bacterium]
MKRRNGLVQALVLAGVLGLASGAPRPAAAHCDTLDGPVVATAKAALEKGDLTPLLKWVQKDDEHAIHEAFEKTLAVRSKGPEAKALADLYFFETLVRIHRAGEGAPYTGLKASEPAVAVAGADKALETGSVEGLVKLVTDDVAEGVKKRFTHTFELKKHADESVAKGREFVASYVDFTHYVEGLHEMATKAGGHHGGAEAPKSEPKHAH